MTTRTDRGGYVDLTVRGHGLSPGWHRIYVGSPGAETIDVPVLVVGTTVTHGIISDIDDTVLSTSLPRPMIAAWNTFMRSEGARRAVPGMATMYRELLAEHPDAPVIYLSTGAWNTAPLSVDQFARVREYITRYRVDFALADADGKLLIEPQSIELAREDRIAARLQHALDLGLGRVDRRARLRALLGRQLAQPLQQLRERSRLAQQARLRLLEVHDAGRRGDGFARCADDLLEFSHQKRKGLLRAPCLVLRRP